MQDCLGRLKVDLIDYKRQASCMQLPLTGLLGLRGEHLAGVLEGACLRGVGLKEGPFQKRKKKLHQLLVGMQHLRQQPDDNSVTCIMAMSSKVDCLNCHCHMVLLASLPASKLP